MLKQQQSQNQAAATDSIDDTPLNNPNGDKFQNLL